MIIKNVHGAKIFIPFGDWEQGSKWSFFPSRDNPNIGTIGVTDSGDNAEDFGLFTREQYNQVLVELEKFKQEYMWDNTIYKWMPNKLVDKEP